MTVYIRTDEGQIAAYDPQSALPRKLKSLLELIDGKTSLAMLEERLRAFGDVRGLVLSLDQAGLVRPLADGTVAEPNRAVAHSRMGYDSVAIPGGTRSPFAQSQPSTRLPSGAASEALRSQALRLRKHL